MNITNITRTTSLLFTLGLALGACQGTDSAAPGAGLGEADSETSGTPDDEDDDDQDSADGSGGSDDGAALGCGNGVVEPDEDCDDDNSDELDGCLSDCRFGPLDIWIDDSHPRVLDQRGNLGGGEAHDDACPNGEVMTGIQGRTGLFIEQVRVECGAVQLFDPDDPEALDLVVLPGTSLPARGLGLALGEFEARCPEDHAVVGFGGNSGLTVEQIILSCARLHIVDDGKSLALGMDEPFDLEPVGGGGGEFTHANCEPGEVATVGNIRSGLVVDAFGLTCMPIDLIF